jgi:hypothetical protein
LPPCERDYDFFSEDIPHCRPSEAALNEMLDDVALNLDEAYPADFSFQEVIEGTPHQEQILADYATVQQGIQIFNWVIWGTWLAYLLLMAFIVLAFARDLDSFLLWVGWPTLVGSGIAVVKFGATLLLIPLLIKYWSVQLPPDTPATVIAHLGSIINAFNLDIQGIGLLLSGGLAFLSALALVGRFLIRRFQSGLPEEASDHWV